MINKVKTTYFIIHYATEIFEIVQKFKKNFPATQILQEISFGKILV